ncbi:MAG: 4-hydroxy-tetrahydrodipicolinate reductase [Acetobacterium sp.]|jgi:4-hydroxy-tetrahydrodipicolinate reductase|uniref:4-hydroxy-tetrahydrodipicolinate reductase n=1 Tax=Acetobacterium carbinolicum TaxID=52690 RepID=UPI0029E24E0B|nr:4-hydroxy-tetrahydrodipicolinate reductase [Acetobacterium sp.]
MINILLSGVSGAMGATLQQIITANPNTQVVAGFDQQANTSLPFPVYTNLETCAEAVDVIIDFSHFAAFPKIFGFAKSKKIPIVIATTGLSETDLTAIKEGSLEFPVFKTANLSLGINLIAKMLNEMVAKLESGFDIEIIEKHHNKKQDAPSGTALLLADAINEGLETKKDYTFGRHGRDTKRTENELGIHAIRGGTIPGEHSVIFAGNDEIIEVNHMALSKKVFAEGAVKAAQYLVGKAPGLYDMSMVVND